jgi:hypothetical protein
LPDPENAPSGAFFLFRLEDGGAWHGNCKYFLPFSQQLLEVQ